MRVFDSHTHLNTDDLYIHRQDYLLQFIQAGGAGLVNSGASGQYNVRGIEITKHIETLKYENKEIPSDFIIKSTIGYHPGCCNDGEITEDNIDQKMADLRLLYQQNSQSIVAIGECGIDTYYPGSENTLPLQKKLFVLQCDLAKELNLPLMLHIRKDFDTAFEIIQHYRDLTVYIHCRGFGPEEIEMLKVESGKLNWNLFIGFCGNITYKNAQNLRDSLSKVSLDHMLLETDAPRLSPQIVRGTTNHPANVTYIYEFIADQLAINPEVLAEQIEKNFHVLYNI